MNYGKNQDQTVIMGDNKALIIQCVEHWVLVGRKEEGFMFLVF